ncbi:MAG: DUF4920 domain-containing protein [Planctomycetes bacterium]|nr:DUF4920 domain-containing protein [Planctomycetota bacterium]
MMLPRSHERPARLRLAGAILTTVALSITTGCVSHRTPLHEPAPAAQQRWNTYSLQPQASIDAMGAWPRMTPDQVMRGEAGQDGAMPVVIEGELSKVCLTMGCWVEMKTSGEPLLVMTRDHEFFVPRNATGVRARAYGRAVAREQSVETLRHIAEDAGASADEIARITEPRTRMVFIADVIAMPPEGLDRPAR